MERQFNNGDFERLLRDNANQYRMYPSEKVWNGVHSALHTRRKWYGLTAAIMFLVTGSIISIFIFNNKADANISQDQNREVISKESQKTLTTSVGKKQKKFTPEVENKPMMAVKSGVQSYLNVPLFRLPANDESEDNRENAFTQSTLTNKEDISAANKQIQNIEETTGIQNAIISIIPAAHLKEISKSESIESNNDIVRADELLSETSVDREIENKIAEAISALASQNISNIKRPKAPARLTAQVFFTPTISYRKLTENKNVYTGSGLAYMPSFDLNNVVKHKPAMGLEFGIESRFRINDNFFIKSGLQFNISRYDIRASSYPTEIATVAVTNGFRVDSLASLSNYRNLEGLGANWLENFYFQAAIPIGIELILSENKAKNIQWGISGTVQPTYVIGDRAYVISSDYKNYAKFPDLMRRWNLSTGAGAFVQYSTGKIKWQVGPHVRYQHLSSFVSALTVKEKLFSAGLKVGATLNKK